MRNCSKEQSLSPKQDIQEHHIYWCTCMCKEQSVLPDTNMSPIIFSQEVIEVQPLHNSITTPLTMVWKWSCDRIVRKDCGFSISLFPLTASLLLLFFLGLLSTNATISITDSDTIRPGQSLNTSEYILSPYGKYKLGFFSTANSTKYYVAIFNSNATENVEWVANREHPFPNPSAVLTFDPDGNLVISDGRLLHVLTNNSGGNDTYAWLLDTGNLILTNRASHVLWQSFDYPTGTLLPGMKIKDDKRGWSLTSWKTKEDPVPRPFSLHMGSGKTQIILMEGSEVGTILD